MSLYKTYKSLKEKYKFHVVMMQCGSFFNFYDEDAEFIADQFNLKLYTLWGHKQCGIPTKANLDKYINFFNETGLSYALIIQIKHTNEIYRVISESNIKEVIGLKIGPSKKISDSNKKNNSEYEFLKAISKGVNPLTGEILDKSSAWKHQQIVDDIEEYFKNLDNNPFDFVGSKNNSSVPSNLKTGVYSDGYYLNGKHFKNQKDWREALKDSDYKNAYQPWNADLDSKLKNLSEKESISNLSKIFNRSKGSIESRLKKLAQIPSDIKNVAKSKFENVIYVASNNSKDSKFHRSSCGWMKNVPLDREIKFKSRDDAIKTGFIPCSSCKP
jgi:hypothetical protein